MPPYYLLWVHVKKIPKENENTTNGEVFAAFLQARSGGRARARGAATRPAVGLWATGFWG